MPIPVARLAATHSRVCVQCGCIRYKAAIMHISSMALIQDQYFFSCCLLLLVFQRHCWTFTHQLTEPVQSLWSDCGETLHIESNAECLIDERKKQSSQAETDETANNCSHEIEMGEIDEEKSKTVDGNWQVINIYRGRRPGRR